ncbi:MAG: hypothetical protein ACLSFT_10585 [Ruminococcus callidus]
MLWLGGIVLAVLAIALTCRRWKPETVHRLLCGLTWAALFAGDLQGRRAAVHGQFRPNYLPLDLCGLSILWNLPQCEPRPLLLEPVYSLSLPGVSGCCFQLVLAAPVELFQPAQLPAPRAAGAGAGGAAGSPYFAPTETAAVLLHLCGGGVRAGFAGEPPLRHQLFFLERPSSGSPLVWFEQVFGSHLIRLPVLMS